MHSGGWMFAVPAGDRLSRHSNFRSPGEEIMTLARAGGVLGVAGVALLLSTVPAAAGAGTWSSVPAPGSGLLQTVYARTDTDAWAVGTAGYLRWNGTNWDAVPTTGLPAVRDPAVGASGAND